MPVITEGALRSFLVLALILCMPGFARAHHSVFPYDMQTFLELEGVLTEVQWRNPHIRLRIAAEDGSGTTVEWELEGDSTNAAARRGLTRDSFSVGDRVRVAGNPSNRGLETMLVTHILLPNGEEHLIHERSRPFRWTEAISSPSANGDRGIFRVWGFGSPHRPTRPFVFTESAARARASWNADTDMLALRCIAPGMPNAVLNPYPIEFIDEGNWIRLRIEQWNATLMIDMVSERIPEDTVPSLHGYSLGSWEGDTLVVTTSHIDFPYVDDEGTPLSADAVITERFSVSEDGSEIQHELTVTDPENFVEPAVVYGTWSWVPGIEVGTFECEPG